MKQQRSLDHDGLDGILQPSDKPQSKPAWFRSLWIIPVIIAFAVSVFLLQKLSQTPLSTETTLAQKKAQVIPSLPAKTPLISGGDKAKPSADAIFTVYFKFDSSKKPLLSKTETRKLINLAKRCQNLISLTGHTCNLGTDAGNQQLGWARANALKKLLITNGIPAQRIVTASKGMRNPVAPNDTKSGQALNRRAELYCLEP